MNYNILIIGLGSIGKRHVHSLKKINPDFTIYALRSSASKDENQDVTNIYSLDELKVKPDFVIIACPTHLHTYWLKQFSKSGIPLFIEKPISNLLDHLSEVKQDLKNTITYVACNLRFYASLEFVKKSIATRLDKINEVNIYCGSYLPDWRKNVNYKTSYSAIEKLGGGAHLDLIHEIDYCIWFFGTPAKVNRFLKKNSDLGIDSVTSAHYVLEYTNFNVFITLNYYRTDIKRTCEIVFGDQTWNIDLIKNLITADEKVIFSSDDTIGDTYLRQMEYFIHSVKNNLMPENNLCSGVNTLKIALACEE